MSILDRNHDKREGQVSDYLKENGFAVLPPTTYHEQIKEPQLKKLLGFRFTPTAQYIRAKADQMAIHLQTTATFLYEVKANYKPQKNPEFPLQIEMMPLVYHRLMIPVGIRCLIVVFEEIPGDSANAFGFWVDELPAPAKIVIPARWRQQKRQHGDKHEWYKRIATLAFPDIYINEHPASYELGGEIIPWRWNGSGDPYVILAKKDIDGMCDWRELIQEEIRTQPGGLCPECKSTYTHIPDGYFLDQPREKQLCEKCRPVPSVAVEDAMALWGGGRDVKGFYIPGP